MDDHSNDVVADREPRPVASEVPRRSFLGLATVALGGLMAMILGVPGLAYVLSPLRRKGKEGAFHTLTRLDQLKVGVPRSFAIIEEREDSWVKYPREPIGSIWLVRQPDGSDPPVIALQSDCPHLGCAINLKADQTGFPLPVPHQCIHVRRQADQPGPTPPDGSPRSADVHRRRTPRCG